MKKAVAVMLSLAMTASLVACGGGSSQPASSGGSSGGDAAASASSGSQAEPEDAGGTVGSEKAYPNANEDGSINLDKVAHFDREYDYTQNPKFKVAYIAADSGPLYQQAAVSYEHWAKMFNCEWMGFTSTNGDSDLYLTTLQNMIDQGVNGFVLDPDSTIFPSINALMEQHPEVSWMSMMSPPRDGDTSVNSIGGNMVHPYVGFDNYDAGWQQAVQLDKWRQENIPDVPLDEIGFAAFDYSISPPLHVRAEAVKDYWAGVTGNADMENFFYFDCAASGINLQGGMDAASPVISTNSKYKYWIVAGIIDDWAQAAATIFDQLGITDNCATCSFGGAALRKQWDAGQFDSYRFALYTDNNLYCEPILGGVYAMMNGWATADTLWPSWINYNDCGADGHTYASLRLPTVWLLPDTYQHYLEWCDMYAGNDLYDYPQEGIGPDDFSPFVDEVPAEYAKK